MNFPWHKNDCSVGIGERVLCKHIVSAPMLAWNEIIIKLNVVSPCKSINGDLDGVFWCYHYQVCATHPMHSHDYWSNAYAFLFSILSHIGIEYLNQTFVNPIDSSLFLFLALARTSSLIHVQWAVLLSLCIFCLFPDPFRVNVCGGLNLIIFNTHAHSTHNIRCY